jgi:hypothetical protein
MHGFAHIFVFFLPSQLLIGANWFRYVAIAQSDSDLHISLSHYCHICSNLYSNQLNGSIPPELGNLPSLQYLFVFDIFFLFDEIL